MPIRTFEQMAEVLHDDLGSHSHVARALGITVRHYLKLRTEPEAREGAVQTLILMRVYCRIIGLGRTYKVIRKYKRDIVREWTNDNLTRRKIQVRW